MPDFSRIAGAMRPRYLSSFVARDLQRKMVFLGGPRQVGKTTLALALLGPDATPEHPAYLNWDIPDARQKILRNELPLKHKLLVFDEVHKYARWRGVMKGLYDRYPRGAKQFLVTGSARLDYYRKGGDSLMGRYHYYRLHPFSLSELDPECKPASLELLLRFGGFPEPLLAGAEADWRRWRNERMERVIHGDLRDLEAVRELSLIDLLVEALPAKVGAPLSLKSLREDLQVSHDSVERWISILERLYLCFRIAPYGPPRIRAVKKEQKLYLWDWSEVPAEGGVRFENLVASQLLKYCHLRQDTQGYRMELRYLRDVERREVDFVVLQDRKPLFAVEATAGDQPHPAAAYFRGRTPIPRFYVVHPGAKDFGDADESVRVLPFAAFCRELDMP